jgi:predicted transcriptional regulator
MMTDMTNPEKAAKELTMLLMYLTRFIENDRLATKQDMAWKGYSFNIINELEEGNYIRQGSRRSKAVTITEDGIEFSKELLVKYNISDWKK